jgi:hypothetical protein
MTEIILLASDVRTTPLHQAEAATVDETTIVQMENNHMLHICCIMLSYLVFFFLYYITLIFNPLCATYKRLSKREQITWTVNFIGAIHAVVATLGSLVSLCFVKFVVPSADVASFGSETGLFLGTSPFSQAMCCLTMGYFLYDLSVFTYLWKLIGGKAEVFFIVHHIMAISGLTFVLIFQKGEYLAACFIFYEVSTPFLHAIYFLKQFNWEHRKVYMWTGVLFYFTFFFGRVVMSCFINYQVFATSIRSFIFSLAESHPYPSSIYSICFGIPVLFLLLNSYWFILLNLKCASEMRNKSDKDVSGKAKEAEPDKKKKIKSLRR